MSDYLAVGGVSAVLRWILANALTGGGPSSIIGVSSPVTALSPDLVPTGADEQPQINLFMYYTSLNANFRNNALPSQDSQGRRVSNPPLALDLHYLVSAYGKNEFDPEILLAWAMQVFYETPILSRELIQNSITGIIDAGHMSAELQLIVTTNLASQIESIRIAPESLSNEEINKLWMAFNAHYRPTTSYQVSVILIEETKSFKSNLPVQSRNLLTLPWQSPIIDNITPQPIGSGEMLTITGRNFIGDSPADTVISFDEQPPIAPDTIQPGCIRIRIPSSLQAGVRTLQIVRNVQFRHIKRSTSRVFFQRDSVPVGSHHHECRANHRRYWHCLHSICHTARRKFSRGRTAYRGHRDSHTVETHHRPSHLINAGLSSSNGTDTPSSPRRSAFACTD